MHTHVQIDTVQKRTVRGCFQFEHVFGGVSLPRHDCLVWDAFRSTALVSGIAPTSACVRWMLQWLNVCVCVSLLAGDPPPLSLLFLPSCGGCSFSGRASARISIFQHSLAPLRVPASPQFKRQQFICTASAKVRTLICLSKSGGFFRSLYVCVFVCSTKELRRSWECILCSSAHARMHERESERARVMRLPQKKSEMARMEAKGRN